MAEPTLTDVLNAIADMGRHFSVKLDANTERLDRLERDLHDFKDAMTTFKSEMTTFKNEMSTFKSEMQTFQEVQADFPGGSEGKARRTAHRAEGRQRPAGRTAPDHQCHDPHPYRRGPAGCRVTPHLLHWRRNSPCNTCCNAPPHCLTSDR